MRTHGILTLTITVALAACHGRDSSATPSRADNRAAAAIGNAVAANDLAAKQAGLPVPQPRAHALDYQLPTSFIGRWGLALSDCNPDNVQDTGLLTIKPDKLIFFASKGSIGAITRRSPYDVTVRLDMTGNGRNWSSETHLVLDAASTRLLRTEASAPGKIYRYKRC